MEGSPTLLGRTPALLKVKFNPYERDVFQAQAARIAAVYHDKTESSAPKATVGPRDSLRKRVLAMSLFPNIYNEKFLQSNM